MDGVTATDVRVFEPAMRLTGLVVLPTPFVVLVNVTVSEYVPPGSELALELMETVTVVEPLGASVPDVLESVTQFIETLCEAVQLIDALPVFASVYSLLDGVNGPPTDPDDESPSAGVTDRMPW